LLLTQISKNCTKGETIAPISTSRYQFCEISTGHELLGFKLFSTEAPIE